MSVEVDEPVTFPLVVMVPNVGVAGMDVLWSGKGLSFHHHHLRNLVGSSEPLTNQMILISYFHLSNH